MRTISHRDLHPMSKTDAIKKPGTAKPTPAPVAEVKVTQAPAPIINIDMSKFSDDNTAALKLLVDAINTQPASPAAVAPKEWEFTVKRDSNNLIQTITAKCK